MPPRVRNYWRAHIELGHLLLAENPDLYLLSYAGSKEQPKLLSSWCPNFNSVYDVEMLDSPHYLVGGVLTEADPLPHVATTLDGKIIILKRAQIDRVSEISRSSWQWFGGSRMQEVYRNRLSFLKESLYMSRKLLGELPIAASGEIDELPEVLMRILIGNYLSSDKIYAPRKEVLGQKFRCV
jgi:hypothetical protein